MVRRHDVGHRLRAICEKVEKRTTISWRCFFNSYWTSQAMLAVASRIGQWVLMGPSAMHDHRLCAAFREHRSYRGGRAALRKIGFFYVTSTCHAKNYGLSWDGLLCQAFSLHHSPFLRFGFGPPWLGLVQKALNQSFGDLPGKFHMHNWTSMMFMWTSWLFMWTSWFPKM